jgi:hypothetical protein
MNKNAIIKILAPHKNNRNVVKISKKNMIKLERTLIQNTIVINYQL